MEKTNLRYSQRAGKEVPVYRIASAKNIFIGDKPEEWDYCFSGNHIVGICYLAPKPIYKIIWHFIRPFSDELGCRIIRVA